MAVFPDDSRMQTALTRFYKNIAPELVAALPAERRISRPICVRPEYEKAQRRLLIVGQETHSWYGLVDDLKEPAGKYR
jgi:hypothetical protein